MQLHARFVAAALQLVAQVEAPAWRARHHDRSPAMFPGGAVVPLVVDGDLQKWSTQKNHVVNRFGGKAKTDGW